MYALPGPHDRPVYFNTLTRSALPAHVTASDRVMVAVMVPVAVLASPARQGLVVGVTAQSKVGSWGAVGGATPAQPAPKNLLVHCLSFPSATMMHGWPVLAEFAIVFVAFTSAYMAV